jgi:hypothetical protein
MENALKVAMIFVSAGVISLNSGVSNAGNLTLSDIRTRCSEAEGSEDFAFCRGYVAALVEGIIVKRLSVCITHAQISQRQSRKPPHACRGWCFECRYRNV